MIIQLYYPGRSDCFRVYHNQQDVIVDPEVNEVRILKNGFLDEKFTLVKKCSPVWTDETKCCNEVLVKLVVYPIEVKISQ